MAFPTYECDYVDANGVRCGATVIKTDTHIRAHMRKVHGLEMEPAPAKAETLVPHVPVTEDSPNAANPKLRDLIARATIIESAMRNDTANITAQTLGGMNELKKLEALARKQGLVKPDEYVYFGEDGAEEALVTQGYIPVLIAGTHATVGDVRMYRRGRKILDAIQKGVSAAAKAKFAKTMQASKTETQDTDVSTETRVVNQKPEADE